MFVFIFIGHPITYTFGQSSNPSGRLSQPSLFGGGKGYSIGFNTQFAVDGLLDQTVYTPSEFIVCKRSKDDQAFRVRVKGMIWQTNQIEEDEREEITRSQTTLALGYEWYRHLGNGFGFHYGAEFENDWENHSVTRNFPGYNPHLGDLLVDRFDVVKTHTLGLLPLAGFTYRLMPNLFISIEMQLKILFKNQKMTSDAFFSSVGDPNNIIGHSWGKYDKESWRFNFQPYSGIFINLIL